MPRQQLMIEGEMHQLDGAVALQLAQTLARCTCTVLWLRSSLKAISFTLSPLTSRSKISRSRGVSTSSAVAGRSPPRSAPQRVGAQVMAAHIDGTHRLHQLFRPAAFGQIAAGAGVQRALHEGGES